MSRFARAMAMFAVLAVLAWTTLSDAPINGGFPGLTFRRLTLALLAFFALRTWLVHRRQLIEEMQDRERAAGNEQQAASR
jgi:hypothetical protein